MGAGQAAFSQQLRKTAGAWRLRRGWRMMLAAPPVFPAGRIG